VKKKNVKPPKLGQGGEFTQNRTNSSKKDGGGKRGGGHKPRGNRSNTKGTGVEKGDALFQEKGVRGTGEGMPTIVCAKCKRKNWEKGRGHVFAGAVDREGHVKLSTKEGRTGVRSLREKKTRKNRKKRIGRSR